MTPAERYQPADWLFLAIRPIRDMFVFTGRSTRSEVAAFTGEDSGSGYLARAARVQPRATEHAAAE